MELSIKTLVYSGFRLLLLLLLGPISAFAVTPEHALTTLRFIHEISNDQASMSLPVNFEATVTYYRKGNIDLFVQDGQIAIYVETTKHENLVAGDRVLIHGITRASFRPEILSDSIQLLHHGEMPPPIDAKFAQLIRADFDCRRVTIRGVIQSANLISDLKLKTVHLELLMDGGSIDAEVNDDNPDALNGLLDSEVEVSGSVGGKFDTKDQLSGILLEVPSLSQVKLLHKSGADASSLPVTPMDEILKFYAIEDRTQRVRVEGAVTYYHPGTAVVLQNGAKSLWISTMYEGPLRVGDIADATGFPNVRDGSLILNKAQIRDLDEPAPVTPQPLTSKELSLGAHAFDLISTEGQVVMAIREAVQDEYVLVSDGHLFSAIYRHPERGKDTKTPPLNHIDLGSRVRVNGICMLDTGDKFQGEVAFSVLLNSPEDIIVVMRPSLFTVRNLSIVVGILLLVVFGTLARSLIFERRVRYQNAALAHLEQRRSQILEDINGSRPLGEIVNCITEMVSFQLNGAPCWCKLADGAQLGNWPQTPAAFRIVEIPITARGGTQLGSVLAAFDSLEKPRPVETEALTMAAGLVGLAIETRRLFADLLRRSEFDLLTEIHNRFSFEKHFDGLIEKSLKEGAEFGLIYIDLDHFKQINDLYGHQIGDSYLQEASRRMKRQLRPTDLLARLGGDEFGALVQGVRCAQDVEEIAHRIEQCFDHPFSIDHHLLHASASMGTAFCPKDGNTRDGLLNAADAAMYRTKNMKRQVTARLDHESGH